MVYRCVHIFCGKYLFICRGWAVEAQYQRRQPPPPKKRKPIDIGQLASTITEAVIATYGHLDFCCIQASQPFPISISQLWVQHHRAKSCSHLPSVGPWDAVENELFQFALSRKKPFRPPRVQPYREVSPVTPIQPPRSNTDFLTFPTGELASCFNDLLNSALAPSSKALTGAHERCCSFSAEFYNNPLNIPLSGAHQHIYCIPLSPTLLSGNYVYILICYCICSQTRWVSGPNIFLSGQ